MSCSLKSCPTLCDPMDHSTPGSLSFTMSYRLLKFMSNKSVILSNRLILCHPHLLLPSIFPSIKVFSMNWLFASGGQSIGASASASLLLMNIQECFPLGLTGWVYLRVQGTLKEPSPTPHIKSISSLVLSCLYGSTLTSIHDYCKTIALTVQTFVRQSNISAF